MAKLVTKETKFVRFVKAPYRALLKARDFYINRMVKCAGHFDGGPVAFSHADNYSLPRSFSTTSSRTADEDLRELIRAASTKKLMVIRAMNSPVPDVNGVPRSQSVGIGRIDEEKPCEFDGDVEVKVGKYPRSRSYAVPRRILV